MDRRNFIKTSTTGIAGVTLGSKLMASSLSLAATPKRPIHVFTKCLQFLDYDQMAAVVAQNGFDGADLTVRPKGQVMPENVERDLPKVLKALQKAGIGTNMITTGINNADDPFTRPILKRKSFPGAKRPLKPSMPEVSFSPCTRTGKTAG